MTGRRLCGTLLAALTLSAAGAAPAAAQNLTRGDYEQCSIYRDGEFIGHDSVCLQRKYAGIRWLERGYDERRGRDRRRQPSVYHCPYAANAGHGYNATWYSDGRPASLMGAYTYDAVMDGRPCIPRPPR
ncbi:hypothetical protein [Brevundimonas basaltis]|uniref:YARHG domain-containing protein n=1 Tax=Brevundimonas basaltis TaxID=472166 RepID=A0A7W8HWT5_9CAUL|nr:hypothetical protein [Brevundimonas basaltis]MBB5291351.1 hypothetical protein [Brevundimonas basaltis]